MHILDAIVFVGLIYGFYQGIRDGLFVSLAVFFSFILGVLGALKFSSLLKTYLEVNLEWDSKMLTLISFVIVLFTVILLIRIIAKLLTKAFSAAYLGWINRFFGGVFQLAKVLLVACILMILFTKINVNNFIISQETLEISYFYRYYETYFVPLVPNLLELFDELFSQSMDQINAQF